MIIFNTPPQDKNGLLTNALTNTHTHTHTPKKKNSHSSFLLFNFFESNLKNHTKLKNQQTLKPANVNNNSKIFNQDLDSNSCINDYCQVHYSFWVCNEKSLQVTKLASKATTCLIQQKKLSLSRETKGTNHGWLARWRW